MKIKIKEMPIEEVLARPVGLHQNPVRPAWIYRLLLKLLSIPDLRATHFTHREIGMDRLGKGNPA